MSKTPTLPSNVTVAERAVAASPVPVQPSSNGLVKMIVQNVAEFGESYISVGASRYFFQVDSAGKVFVMVPKESVPGFSKSGLYLG
jgi:hypothetical protein